MRKGNNPRRGKDCARYTKVVLSVVTHLPELTGYHERRFEVVKTCLQSMKQNSGGEYTVIVWDNGSCEQFREWVRQEYKPDIFVESDNIGKNLARSSIFGMLPPEQIVSYCDDDIYFYPNWLDPQLELLKSFPDTACVSGYPVRTQFRWGNENTLTRLESVCKIEKGKFIPDKWEDDFAVSTGRDVREHRQLTVKDFDIIGEYKGHAAYLTAHHCQFIGKAETLRAAALSSALYGSMPDERPFDIALDKLGNRLTTIARLTRHIGNIIDDDLRRDMVVK